MIDIVSSVIFIYYWTCIVINAWGLATDTAQLQDLNIILQKDKCVCCNINTLTFSSYALAFGLPKIRKFINLTVYCSRCEKKLWSTIPHGFFSGTVIRSFCYDNDARNIYHKDSEKRFHITFA